MTAPVPLPDPTAPAAPAPSRALPDGVTPAFARSVRLWSRAYPRRWRAVRGEELLGLLADLAAPGARRLDARSAFDLVRAGWATRLREHPPLGPWLRYRLLDTRSLRDHRGWVADDITGLLYPGRQVVAPLLVLAMVEVLVPLTTGDPGPFGRSWFVLLAIVPLSFLVAPDHTRRRAMENHLVPRQGEAITPGAWVRVSVPRRRVAARSGLPWLAGALAWILASALAAAALSPMTLSFRRNQAEEGPGFGAFAGEPVPRLPVLLALALALVAGVVLAAAAVRRLRRVELAQQSGRQLIGMGIRRPTTIVIALLTGTVLPVVEALGEVPLAVSLLLGLAAGVLAPPAIAAWAMVRRLPTGAALAATDAWRLALSGRRPAVDAPASALVPADASSFGVVQPWPWSNEGPTTALG